MKRLIPMVFATMLLALISAPTSHAAFGLKDLDVTFNNQDGSIATQAGAHPYSMTTTVAFNTRPDPEVGYDVPDGDLKHLRAFQMPGLIGNPDVVPTCDNSEFLANNGGCPATAQVGINAVTYGDPTNTSVVPVYSLDPPPGVAMKLGFHILFVPVTVEIGVNDSPPSNIVASLTNVSNSQPVYRSELTLWGVPAAASHDPDRSGVGCGGGCSVDLDPKPLLTAPRTCGGPLSTKFEAVSWQDPDSWFEESISTHDEAQPPNPQGLIGCGKLGFEPAITAQPTSKAASSPTGMDFSLDVHDEGINNPDGLAQSDIRKAVVTLPEGFTTNPSIAEGLTTCSEADLARERYNSDPGAGCPDASKVGTVEVETPLLENELLTGSLFIATPYENPFGSLLALYVVIRSEELGVLIRQPLEVVPDPVTGQLTTIAEEMPQLPFSHFRLHFREGARSPLATPPVCGSHEVKAVLYPWSGGLPITATSAFEVITGPNSGPCPSGGLPPFRPGLMAGTLNNAAGSYSPFNLRLSRSDSEQEFTHFSIKLPPGVTGKLAGIPFCPDAAIEAAKARTGPHGGQEEIEQPSCPAASQIGRTLVGAGVGPSQAYAPGKVYLAGPYNGSALSIAAITAARVGPFDLGTVVVREALRISPETAEVFVDATGSDPIPHIIRGIPVHLRDVRVYVDRPQFMLNPTNCEPTTTASTLLGSGLDFGSPSDDNPITVSTRFQAADCGALRFRPGLSISLRGGTRRGKTPSLKAVLTPRPGDANIGRAVVTLPGSEFLEQGNIRTVCTRVQFAAGPVPGAGCPAGSIYGHAQAITPLLDEPVEGPVIMRSNGGERDLPDLVATLHAGKIDFNLVGFIDSAPIKGTERSRIRNTFATAPDVPVTKFTLEMAGGKKGLLVNSTNICRGVHRANASFTGQNGKVYRFAPEVKASCGKKGNRKRKR